MTKVLLTTRAKGSGTSCRRNGGSWYGVVWNTAPRAHHGVHIET